MEHKSIVGDDNYFFVITTLLKFFSRAIQLSYIISGQYRDVPSTRDVFNRAVVSFGSPTQELNNIITNILDLFLVDTRLLNPRTFYDFAYYKDTPKYNWEYRITMPLHKAILHILQQSGFVPPQPELMGGKKNKLKTKRKTRKAMKTRKTRKAMKTRKTKNNNTKKKFTKKQR